VWVWDLGKERREGGRDEICDRGCKLPCLLIVLRCEVHIREVGDLCNVNRSWGGDGSMDGRSGEADKKKIKAKQEINKQTQLKMN